MYRLKLCTGSLCVLRVWPGAYLSLLWCGMSGGWLVVFSAKAHKMKTCCVCKSIKKLTWQYYPLCCTYRPFLPQSSHCTVWTASSGVSLSFRWLSAWNILFATSGFIFISIQVAGYINAVSIGLERLGNETLTILILLHSFLMVLTGSEIIATEFTHFLRGIKEKY